MQQTTAGLECSSKSSDEGQTWCWCSFWSQRVLTGLRYFRCTIKLSAAKSALFVWVTIFLLWFLDTGMSPSRLILVNSIESVWCLMGRLVIDRLINAGMLVYNWDESNNFGWIMIRLVSLCFVGFGLLLLWQVKYLPKWFMVSGSSSLCSKAESGLSGSFLLLFFWFLRSLFRFFRF